MSRAEELKKKFAEKARAAAARAESGEVDFTIRLNEILETEKNADASSQRFVDRLHAKFVEDAPTDVESWIKEQTRELFVSVATKPVWVYETSWCFDGDGNPLEFLHQFEDENGVSYYVFRGYREGQIHGVRGKVRFLKVAAQDRNGIIHLAGEVVG